MFAWPRSNRERAVLSYKEAIELAKQSHRERSIRLPHRRWRGPRARVIDPVAGACAPRTPGNAVLGLHAYLWVLLVTVVAGLSLGTTGRRASRSHAHPFGHRA